MKRRLLNSQYIQAMTLINPPLTKQTGILVEVFQRDEGPIPYVHVFHDKTRNKKNVHVYDLASQNIQTIAGR